MPPTARSPCLSVVIDDEGTQAETVHARRGRARRVADDGIAHREDVMATDTKQDVVVTRKQELQKAPPQHAGGPLQELERAMERFMGMGWMRPFSWERPPWRDWNESFGLRVPAVDVIDMDDRVLVRAEVPGVDKKDIEVTATDTMLTIKGNVTREEKEERGDYYRCEISRGSFSRTVSLPSGADPDRVKAVLKDGVLEVSIPKLDEAKRRVVTVE
jgi:HSP20 family protein